MTTTFCSSGAVVLKAGLNVSPDITETQWTQMINQAENMINVAVKESGVDLVTEFSSMDANVQKVLEDCASSYAAIIAINYDMSGYTSRSEAQTMLDVNYSRVEDLLKMLTDKKNMDYLRSFNT